MLQNNRKKQFRWSKGKMSSDVIEAQSLFKQAWPVGRFDGSVKTMITVAFRYMSPRVEKTMTYRRVETIYHGTARRIDSQETDVMRRAVREEHEREMREIRARLAFLDARLSGADEEFYGPTLEALRAQASGQGK